MIFVGGRVYAPGYPGATAVVTDARSISFVGSDEAAREVAPGRPKLIFVDGWSLPPSSMPTCT